MTSAFKEFLASTYLMNTIPLGLLTVIADSALDKVDRLNPNFCSFMFMATTWRLCIMTTTWRLCTNERNWECVLWAKSIFRYIIIWNSISTQITGPISPLTIVDFSGMPESRIWLSVISMNLNKNLESEHHQIWGRDGSASELRLSFILLMGSWSNLHPVLSGFSSTEHMQPTLVKWKMFKFSVSKNPKSLRLVQIWI